MLNKRESLKERASRLDKLHYGEIPKPMFNTLSFYLTSSESDTDIAHVLQSLEDNLEDRESIDTANLVLNRFTYKAVQTNQALQWLDISNKLITAYNRINKTVPSQLCISKAICLGKFSTLNKEIELCLNHAIDFSENNFDKIEALIMLAEYYDSIGKYIAMRDILLSSEKLCNNEPKSQEYLSRIWCILGCFYFITFNIKLAQKYFNQSLKILRHLDITNDNSASKLKLVKTLTTCLHYIGRIQFEKYNFKDCVNLYIEAKVKLKNYCDANQINQDIGATAFYHLRLGQVLEICDILNSANYHYQKSHDLFEEFRPSPSGLSQSQLAVSGLIDDKSRQEREFKKVIRENIEIGYSRGYLLACIQLFALYCKTLKVHLALIIVWEVFRNSLTYDSVNFIYLTILLRKMFLSAYGLGIYAKLKVTALKLYKSNRILDKCPCQDPECKQNNLRSNKGG